MDLIDLIEKITNVWMEGFWYERPVDYKAEWNKLYQSVRKMKNNNEDDE